MTEAESAIREFFESYNDCYNRLDTPGAAAHHGSPSFVVNRGEIVHLNDETKIDYFDSVFAENIAEGEHVWEIAKFNVNQLTSNGAIATVSWIARHPDGSVLWTSRASYMVADDGNGWLIWGDIVHTPD